ncbi:24561_t:CDS:1, partial [Racocetra persica]
YIYPIPHEMTIKEFFVKLTTEELSLDCNIDIINPEAIERVEISKAQDTTATQVSINYNIIEVTTSVEIYVHYRLKTENPNFNSEQ